MERKSLQEFASKKDIDSLEDAPFLIKEFLFAESRRSAFLIADYSIGNLIFKKLISISNPVAVNMLTTEVRYINGSNFRCLKLPTMLRGKSADLDCLIISGTLVKRSETFQDQLIQMLGRFRKANYIMGLWEY